MISTIEFQINLVLEFFEIKLMKDLPKIVKDFFNNSFPNYKGFEETFDNYNDYNIYYLDGIMFVFNELFELLFDKEQYYERRKKYLKRKEGAKALALFNYITSNYCIENGIEYSSINEDN